MVLRKFGNLARLNKAEKGSKNCQKKHHARPRWDTRSDSGLAMQTRKRVFFLSSRRCIAWFICMSSLHQPNNMHCASFWSPYLGGKKRRLNYANAILLEPFIHPSPSHISCDDSLVIVFITALSCNAITLIQTLERPLQDLLISFTKMSRSTRLTWLLAFARNVLSLPCRIPSSVKM